MQLSDTVEGLFCRGAAMPVDRVVPELVRKCFVGAGQQTRKLKLEVQAEQQLSYFDNQADFFSTEASSKAISK